MQGHVHMLIDPAEVCGIAGAWLHQRKECDSFGVSIRGTQAQFCRATLLGESTFIGGRPG